MPASERAEAYREPSNDGLYQPAPNHQAKLNAARPVAPINRVEDLQTRPVFQYQDPKTLSGHAKAAVSTYQGVAEALPPQKIELLGIDIFV